MKAAIYCRVSTDNQEREGTSLDSQRDACLVRAKELDYEVPPDNILLETYTGATLDRPKLNTLRDWIRNKEIEAVIVHAFDRLSRDPVDFLILQDEMERYNVTLAIVTETLDNTDEGKLILHVKGFAAKLERAKIRERTLRGKKTRVEKIGKLPCGRGILYGYDYIPEKNTQGLKGGVNVANNDLQIVRQMGLWVKDRHIFVNEVCRRLDKMGIPTPKGGTTWSRGTVGRILRNSTYAGLTYANKTTTQITEKDGKRVVKRLKSDQSKLIEIPNAVDKPAFTLEEWEAIQRQLDRNRALSPRRQKYDYMLKGLVYCKSCGRKFYGMPSHGVRYYRCSGRNSLLLNQKCDARAINADDLEQTAWEAIETEILKPDLVMKAIRRRANAYQQGGHLQEQIAFNNSRLAELAKIEDRYLKLYGIGRYTKEKLDKEVDRVRLEAERIKKENEKLNCDLKLIYAHNPSLEDVKYCCHSILSYLKESNQKQKRRVFEIFNWRIGVIDKDTIEIEGILDYRAIPKETSEIGLSKAQPL